MHVTPILGRSSPFFLLLGIIRKKKGKKRRKKVIQLFSCILNETGVVTNKEEEGERSK
jgi:hypothetical protein